MARGFNSGNKQEEELPKPKLNKELLKRAAQILAYLKPFRTKFLLGMLFLILSSLAMLTFPALLGAMIDASEGKQTYTWLPADVFEIGSIAFVILTFTSIVSFFRIRLFVEIAEKSLASIRRDSYQKLISLPMEYFANRRVGELNSRLSADLAQIQDTMTTTLAEILRQCISLAFGVALLVFVSPKLALMNLCILPVLVVTAIVFGKFIRNLSRQAQDKLVGSESLLNEAEFILIYHEALKNLGLQDFTIKINNRKILSGIAEIIGKPELIVDMTVAIDKLDKIGLEGVNKELLERGFTTTDLEILRPIILLEGSNEEKLSALKHVLSNSEIGLMGVAEIEETFDYISKLDSSNEVLQQFVEVDITLARGLNYYTGCIFEVKTNEVAMGSIGGGGRYDDLTGMFGLKGLTGVGVSFGADRIYDVLEELNLYPEAKGDYTKLLIVNFDKETESFTLPLLNRLRQANVAVELYPTAAKLKKQMSYEDSKGIPYVLLIGDEEVSSGQLSLKDMQTGDQRKIDESTLIAELS